MAAPKIRQPGIDCLEQLDGCAIFSPKKDSARAFSSKYCRKPALTVLETKFITTTERNGWS